MVNEAITSDESEAAIPPWEKEISPLDKESCGVTASPRPFPPGPW